MTDPCPHTCCCCWWGLCLCSPRCLQAAGLCCHKRLPGKFLCMMYYSWRVSHGCAATAAALELLTRLFLPCARVKKVFAGVLCRAVKWNVSTPFEDLNDNRIPLTILSLRAQKQLSFINFSKSYSMRWPPKKGMAVVVKVLYFLPPFICA